METNCPLTIARNGEHRYVLMATCTFATHSLTHTLAQIGTLLPSTAFLPVTLSLSLDQGKFTLLHSLQFPFIDWEVSQLLTCTAAHHASSSPLPGFFLPETCFHWASFCCRHRRPANLLSFSLTLFLLLAITSLDSHSQWLLMALMMADIDYCEYIYICLIYLFIYVCMCIYACIYIILFIFFLLLTMHLLLSRFHTLSISVVQ